MGSLQNKWLAFFEKKPSKPWKRNNDPGAVLIKGD